MNANTLTNISNNKGILQNQNHINKIPISLLNEINQRNKFSVPPKYSFKTDPNNGYFYCELEVYGKIFTTEHSLLRKKDAKENVTRPQLC